MRHRSIIVGSVLLLLAPVVSGAMAESAEDPTEEYTLGLSLTPVKHTYALGEALVFEIRIDNPTDEEVCVPRALRCGQGYLLYTTIDPSGERVIYECEIVTEFQGDAGDIVCLSPGSFYGVRDDHSGLRVQGEWTFAATYYGPSSREHPRLCGQEISSPAVLVLVGERRKEPN